MSTPATATIESIESARNKARAAATHPRVVELRAVLSSPTATTPEKRKAQDELVALRPERKALLKQGRDELNAEQAKLSALRKAGRDAYIETLAAKLREETTEQLEERRAKLEGERHAIKRQHRAVVKVLGERDAERRISDLIATMSDADKRALLQQLQVGGVESAEKVGTPGAS